MLVFLLFSMITACVLASHAPHASALLIEQLHRSCLKACPPSVHADFLKAVVCGESLAHANSAAFLKSDFAKTGLIHLLVVSGSHLICLEQVVAIFSRPVANSRLRSAMIFSALLFFTLMTGASPPVLRALIGWCFRALSKREGWNWTRVQILTVSGFATLPFCKDQWDLCSLGLGWIAALALGFSINSKNAVRKNLSLTEHFERWREKIWRLLIMNFYVYVAVVPALMPLGVPSSFSIVTNLLFAPVMGLVLFPVSLLSFAWSGFVGLADAAWTASLWLVSSAAQMTPDAWEKVNLSPLWLTPYIFLLTLWFVYRDHRPTRLHLAKMRAPVGTCTLVLLVAIFTAAQANADELIVWNIGQGAWATLKTKGLCQHFDMGGEWAPRRKISDACRSNRNEVFYSHWDWDHIGLTRTAIQLLPNLCVQAAPGGPAPNKFKAGLIQSIPHCDHSPLATEIFLSKISDLQKSHLHDANDFSQVFIEDRVIFPGDSPKKEEKIWRRSPLLKGARILIAGHHGSKSATSDELLAQLKTVKMIVASAHKIRYGHPHPLMLARAQKYLLPVLKTEDWGSLHFDLPVPPPKLAGVRRL